MTIDKDRRSISRRAFLAAAATSTGASIAVARGRAEPSRSRWVERRARFLEGVASGDPQADSVILWTRVVWGNTLGTLTRAPIPSTSPRD